MRFPCSCPPLQHYRSLPRSERLALLRSLVTAFGVQASEVDAAAAAWQALRAQQAAGDARAWPGNVAAPGGEPLLKAAAQLAGAATSAFQRLIPALAQQPGGIRFLVDVRAELLQARARWRP